MGQVYPFTKSLNTYLKIEESARMIHRTDAIPWLKDAFDTLTDSADVLGDPNGEFGYAYLRVSSSGQAEEGRAGLYRQLDNIGQAAKRAGICIPWDMVFFDDATGFTFEDRPSLLRLLDEVNTNPRSNKLIMEYPDRLSRDHTWRYGYLREQFEKCGIEFVY